MKEIPAWLAVALCLAVPVRNYAQARGGQERPPTTAKAAAPVDLTGYWVSIVTEDWRFRMLTPPKGDYAGVPLNAEGRKVADAWDPAKDEAGEQCKSYGAPAIMRVPGRLHITWADDYTLKIETDAGTQTRLLHFGRLNYEGPSLETLQGISMAQWEYAGGAREGQNVGVSVFAGAVEPSRGGDLKVVTSHMRPGYLRKNGVPYSGNAVLTEYFHRTVEPNGDSWLIVTTLVEDPQYLTGPWQTSTHFRKQADASGWDPTPCTAR